MPKALDLTGQRFGKLIAIQKLPSRNKKTYWLCQCDCGKQTEVQTCHLVDGSTTSCGCNINANRKKEQPTVAFRKRIKTALVTAFGQQCACCGLQDNPVMYDFHHIIPETKTFGIGNGTTTHSRQAYLDEAKKCVLLCANCHRRIENNLITINDLHIIPINEKLYWDTLDKLLKDD